MRRVGSLDGKTILRLTPFLYVWGSLYLRVIFTGSRHKEYLVLSGDPDHGKRLGTAFARTLLAAVEQAKDLERYAAGEMP